MSSTYAPVTEDLAAPPRTAGDRTRGAWRHTWPTISALLALVLWWPGGFWGTGEFLHLPLHPSDGDMLLLGAMAAAASVSLVVRSPGVRLLVVMALSAVGWLLSGPALGSSTGEWPLLLGLLVAGGVVGLLLGARGHRGPLSAATVLALVAGLSPATWPHGAVLAVALALPCAAVTRRNVVGTVWQVARVMLTWLVAALIARSLAYGWAVLLPSAGSEADELRPVAAAAGDFVRLQWWRFTDGLLHDTAGWFWVALVLALIVVAGRVLRGQVGGPDRTADAPYPRTTSGGPRQ